MSLWHPKNLSFIRPKPWEELSNPQRHMVRPHQTLPQYRRHARFARSTWLGDIWSFSQFYVWLHMVSYRIWSHLVVSGDICHKWSHTHNWSRLLHLVTPGHIFKYSPMPLASKWHKRQTKSPRQSLPEASPQVQLGTPIPLFAWAKNTLHFICKVSIITSGKPWLIWLGPLNKL